MANSCGTPLVRRPRAWGSIAPERRFSSLFDELFSSWGSDLPFSVATERAEAFVPKLAVTEDATGVMITAELPGMSEKDVEVELKKDHLVLKGQKKSERDINEGEVHYSERSFGSFQRVVPLNFEVDEDSVDATYKNGVLSIRLPKSVKAKSESRRVSIKTS